MQIEGSAKSTMLINKDLDQETWDSLVERIRLQNGRTSKVKSWHWIETGNLELDCPKLANPKPGFPSLSEKLFLNFLFILDTYMDSITRRRGQKGWYLYRTDRIASGGDGKVIENKLLTNKLLFHFM